jgi:hypothetical protein
MGRPTQGPAIISFTTCIKCPYFAAFQLFIHPTGTQTGLRAAGSLPGAWCTTPLPPFQVVPFFQLGVIFSRYVTPKPPASPAHSFLVR